MGSISDKPSLGEATSGEAKSAAGFKGKGGFQRIVEAARYSLLGMSAGWRHEAAFRQEVVLGLMLLAGLPWIAPSIEFGALMGASVLLVWCVEMLNSAIEALADAISADVNPLLGRAKDFGSAAVLFCLLLAAGVWSVAIYLQLGS